MPYCNPNKCPQSGYCRCPPTEFCEKPACACSSIHIGDTVKFRYEVRKPAGLTSYGAYKFKYENESVRATVMMATGGQLEVADLDKNRPWSVAARVCKRSEPIRLQPRVA